MACLPRNLAAVFVAAFLAGAGLAAFEPPPERQFVFTVFSSEPISNLGYVARPGGVAEPLLFYPTARSPQCTYAGPATVRFVDLRSGAVAAETTVTESARNLLFLFTLEPASPGKGVRYRVQGVNDGRQEHPAGSVRFLNLSGLVLAGTLNSRPINLVDGFSSPIPVGNSAAVILRTAFRNRTYQSFADTISLDPSTRCLLILLPPYRAGSLEVQSRLLLDTPAPPPGRTANN